MNNTPSPSHAETFFAAALDRTDPAARAALLERACGSDATLRAEVESLLAAHATARRTLARLADTLRELRLQRVTQLPEPANPAPQTGPAQAPAQLARALPENPGDVRATYRLLSFTGSRRLSVAPIGKEVRYTMFSRASDRFVALSEPPEARVREAPSRQRRDWAVAWCLVPGTCESATDVGLTVSPTNPC